MPSTGENPSRFVHSITNEPHSSHSLSAILLHTSEFYDVVQSLLNIWVHMSLKHTRHSTMKKMHAQLLQICPLFSFFKFHGNVLIFQIFFKKINSTSIKSKLLKKGILIPNSHFYCKTKLGLKNPKNLTLQFRMVAIW